MPFSLTDNKIFHAGKETFLEPDDVLDCVEIKSEKKLFRPRHSSSSVPQDLADRLNSAGRDQVAALAEARNVGAISEGCSGTRKVKKIYAKPVAW